MCNNDGTRKLKDSAMNNSEIFYRFLREEQFSKQSFIAFLTLRGEKHLVLTDEKNLICIQHNYNENLEGFHVGTLAFYDEIERLEQPQISMETIVSYAIQYGVLLSEKYYDTIQRYFCANNPNYISVRVPKTYQIGNSRKKVRELFFNFVDGMHFCHPCETFECDEPLFVYQSENVSIPFVFNWAKISYLFNENDIKFGLIGDNLLPVLVFKNSDLVVFSAPMVARG